MFGRSIARVALQRVVVRSAVVARPSSCMAAALAQPMPAAMPAAPLAPRAFHSAAPCRADKPDPSQSPPHLLSQTHTHEQQTETTGASGVGTRLTAVVAHCSVCCLSVCLSVFRPREEVEARIRQCKHCARAQASLARHSVLRRVPARGAHRPDLLAAAAAVARCVCLQMPFCSVCSNTR